MKSIIQLPAGSSGITFSFQTSHIGSTVLFPYETSKTSANTSHMHILDETHKHIITFDTVK